MSTDTVGFISKLPHHLVEAFKSTLEEIKEASLILHIVDGSNQKALKQAEVVDEDPAEPGSEGHPDYLCH
ncbi:MAG: hypothetical protein MZU97_10305 [Bacillus subtilis]|nr:hypothetical protein [Bacillus subtilis]